MRYVRCTDRSFWVWHRLPSLPPPLPRSCTVTVGGPCAYAWLHARVPPSVVLYGRPLVTGMTFYIYACDFYCHTLGSDGTVSFWDKDARTRMKSKPSPLTSFPSLDPLFSLCSSPHFGVCSRSFFINHSSPIHSVLPRSSSAP